MHPIGLGSAFVVGVLMSPTVRKALQKLEPRVRGIKRYLPFVEELEVKATGPKPTRTSKRPAEATA